MGLIAVKRLLLALASKPGVRVGAVPVHIGVVVIALAVLLFQAKQVHLGGDMGGIDDVQAIGDEAPFPGLLHHLVEEFLEPLRPQPHPEAAEGGVIRGQLLGAQTQEPLVNHVESGLFFDLPVRQVIEELQADHFEHQHRVPGVPAPIHVKVPAGLPDEAKIHGSGQVFQEVVPFRQEPFIDQIAEKGAVG